jgi:hypothetical protein
MAPESASTCGGSHSVIVPPSRVSNPKTIQRPCKVDPTPRGPGDV